MPRDNNPSTTSSEDPAPARDNNPTTIERKGHATEGGEEVCPTCGSTDWDTRPVPKRSSEDDDSGYRTADVCQSCGYVTPDEESKQADKR